MIGRAFQPGGMLYGTEDVLTAARTRGNVGERNGAGGSGQ